MGKADDPRQEKGRSFLQRREKVTELDDPVLLITEEADTFPALLEFLSACRWPDGKKRKPGSITLFVDQGRIKVALNDRDQDLVCFVTLNGLGGLFDALELVLSEGSGDWRTTGQRRKQ